MNDPLLHKALEALKDIIGAADNGQPYTPEELEAIFLPILNEAFEAGVRLAGED
jgi:hypothetical protein